MVELNGLYKTSDFQEAIFLRVSGIIFVSTEWPTPNQAFFVFKRPPDTILSEWATGQDKSVRIVLDAADFFRDEIRRRDR